MKRLNKIKYLAFFLPLYYISISVLGQGVDDDKNYLIKYQPKVEETEISALEGGTISTVLKNKVYTDGFGKAIQTLAIKQSPSQGDIVIPTGTVDLLGRPEKTYLPFATSPTNNGDFVSMATNASNWTDHFGSVEDDYAFSANVYEKSPVGRVLKQGAPGSAWQPDPDIGDEDKTIWIEYNTNVASEVFKWQITNDGKLLLSEDKYYGANELSVIVTKDENWVAAHGDNGTVKVYKNKYGQEILTKTYESGEPYETYKVYDEFGNLRFIIPPTAIQYVADQDIGSINDNQIFKSYTELSSTYNSAYYYLPGVEVVLKVGFQGDVGFSIAPYPISAEIIENYLYQFEYDEYDRPVAQKSPGSGWSYIIYDDKGREILSQDAEQRKSNKWAFVKYDQLDRPILTGIFQDNTHTSRESMQSYLLSAIGSTFSWSENLGGSVHGYTNNAFPNVSDENGYLTVSYYDNYDFLTGWGTDFNFDGSNGINNGPKADIIYGETTGSKVKILGDNTWLKSVSYYDNQYLRPIQMIADHHMGELVKTYISYDFTGNIVLSKMIHEINPSKSVSVTERFEFDHAGRISEVYHRLDNNPEVLISQFHYDELGELGDKKLHKKEDGTFAQSIDYSYNIRGWLSKINNAARSDGEADLFGMELYYDTDPAGINYANLYNGNLAGVVWGNSDMGNKKRSFGYGYDLLDRLTNASFKEYNGSVWTKSGYYDVNINEYDKNGNIKDLTRRANNVLIDDLDYTYKENTNQLSKVTDATNNPLGFDDGASENEEYGYNDNGSLSYDKNKGISNISYNELNLPDIVAFNNGNEIHFVYDALGNKLTQKFYKNQALVDYTDYTNGMIFENDSLRVITTSEGRIMVHNVANDFDYDYQYILPDHLGSARVLFAPLQRVYTATMESELSTEEESQFKSITNRTTVTNHTPSGVVANPNESVVLKNTSTVKQVVGPAKGLKVYPGDVVDMEVWAKYDNTCGVTGITVGEFLFTALTASFGITGAGETQQIHTALNEVVGSNMLFNQISCDVPRAFINYIFFDKNYDNYYFGARQISSAANGSFEKLSLSTTTIDEEGYLYIYVSNESNLPVNIYFDDLVITHTSSASMLQADDFYAFGLAIDDFHHEKEKIETNRFLYQGKEWMDEEDQAMAMYDFHARLYDLALGRFMGVDPAGQFASPYMAMGNNPVIGVDPDGEFVFTAILPGVGVFIDAALWGAVIGGAGYTANVGFSEGGFNNWDWGQFGKSAAMGAVSGVATAGIGSAFGAVGSNGILGEVARAGTHGIINSGVNMGFGNDVSLGTFAIGAGGSLMGSALDGASVGVQIGGTAAFSGTVAELSGGDFWRGAATGATIGGLNHVKHRIEVGVHVKAVRAFLKDSGFSPEMAKRDVTTQSKGFFSKAYARFNGDIADYGDFFTGGQYDSYSDTRDAYISKFRSMKYSNGKHAIRESLAIKYYPSRSNSIGLVQTGVDHWFEAAFEGLDGKIREWTGKDNTFYDMHGYNSKFYLKWRTFFN
jgi:RHS repeat-associated protein